MILDFHTHAFPDALAPHAISNLKQKTSLAAFTDGTVAGLKQSMHAAGIDHSVVCNIAVKPGQTEKVHRFAQSLLGDEQLTPLASLHPLEPDWKQWIATIKQDGFAGIKLHPDYQDFAINDPALIPFYEEIFRQDLLLLFHAGWDAGYPTSDWSTPARIVDILPILEQGTTVLAHIGANAHPKETLDFLCGRKVYFDTSYALEKLAIKDVKDIIETHTPQRILFGSDVPWADQTTYVNYFTQTIAPGFLSPQEQADILWNNGARLLGL